MASSRENGPGNGPGNGPENGLEKPNPVSTRVTGRTYHVRPNQVTYSIQAVAEYLIGERMVHAGGGVRNVEVSFDEESGSMTIAWERWKRV